MASKDQTNSVTLPGFLLARIAEDEAWANAAVGTPGATHWHWVDAETDQPVAPDPFTQSAITDDGAVSLRSVEELAPVTWGSGNPLPDFVIWQVDDMTTPGAAGHIARHDPARVLAECEAKRRIVDDAFAYLSVVIPDRRDALSVFLESTLRALALPYADHPDYREEWRP